MNTMNFWEVIAIRQRMIEDRGIESRAALEINLYQR
jgi:hypothetical protein